MGFWWPKYLDAMARLMTATCRFSFSSTGVSSLPANSRMRRVWNNCHVQGTMSPVQRSEWVTPATSKSVPIPPRGRESSAAAAETTPGTLPTRRQQFAHEAYLRFRSFVSLERQIQTGEQHMVGLNAESDRSLEEETAHEKSSPGEQEEREGHFTDDQHEAQAAAPGAPTACSL